MYIVLALKKIMLPAYVFLVFAMMANNVNINIYPTSPLTEVAKVNQYIPTFSDHSRF